MTSALILGIVSLATFGLASLVLASLVALAWYAGLSRARTGPADLLALRLLPVAGALLLVVAVVLPAFLSFEPRQTRESVGPLVLILAAFALYAVGDGVRRGWRACSAARSFLQACSVAKRCVFEHGHSIQVVDIGEPIIGVVGAWRPQVVTAECVVSACTRDEFLQVIAHEAAHVSARDNLKLLLLLACPDTIAWTPLGATLFGRWRTEAEFAADQRATGDDPHKRLALASALIKVARLVNAGRTARHPLAMSVGMDDVEGRVRQLLGPAQIASATLWEALAWLAVLIPLAAIPFYALLHELVETLVRVGL